MRQDRQEPRNNPGGVRIGRSLPGVQENRIRDLRCLSASGDDKEQTQNEIALLIKGQGIASLASLPEASKR